MPPKWMDMAGEPAVVRVELSGLSGSYVVPVAEGSTADKVDFLDAHAATARDRIIFHTEVDPRFGGRGLSGVLVQEALLDTIRSGFRVVSASPLFAAHLNAPGRESFSDGRVFRRPTPDDLSLISQHA